MASSSSRSWKYDVFLSFRGEDTRKTFVDHLYHALKNRMVRTYKDNETLLRGDTIVPSLLNAIEDSQIALIIFSENYASSSWCLDELAYIMKCRRERGQIVMPIFYDLEPSEVRKQNRKYKEAFAKHELENNIKAESWRKALFDASNIAGWETKHIANGHEAQGIEDIVGTILDRFLLLNSSVDENLVGMGTRLQDLKSRLQIGSGGVRMVGIWGIGGSGKTTLVSSLFMEISSMFDSCCFLESIKEESNIKSLQEKILSTVFDKKVEVDSVDIGKRKIKGMLSCRNVLVVLDDVDDRKQQEALAGSHDWFGDGSRIIITTRDEHLLRTHKVDEVSHVSLLSDEEAIRLFDRRAYNENILAEDYKMLSQRVVSYAAGLPLALIILGSFLYDKNMEEWISTLDRLKDIPEMKIVEVLKISYDGLTTIEKELFLDIACFFRGTDKNEAMEMLDACGFHPGIGVKVLIQKALITISSYDYGPTMHDVFEMHDLVQEMGHYIVRGKYPNNPEKHSRLWQFKKIDDMCSGNETTKNNKTEAIISYGYPSRFGMFLSKAKKLRLLSVHNRNQEDIIEVPEYLSSKLRYLYWEWYPASPFPESFQLRKLVVLRLNFCLQEELWRGNKSLPCLKELQLSYAYYLVRTPDFSGLPCLQKLALWNCNNLEEIHSSLGNHKSIVSVNVKGCKKLEKFPAIGQMGKLEILKISRCGALRKFPTLEALPSTLGKYCIKLRLLKLKHCREIKSIEGNFHALKHLHKCEIHGLQREFICDHREPIKLPKDLFNQNIRLEELHLYYTRQPSIFYLPRYLRRLTLRDCGLKDGEIPFGIGDLTDLQELDLSWNEFSRLNFSLSRLSQLKVLNLSFCKRLVELPELPSNIASLQANYCESLLIVGDIVNRNCKWLCEVSLRSVRSVTDSNRLLQTMLQGHQIENRCISLQLDGLEIPNGFIPPLLRRKRYILKLPDNWFNQFSGFLFCAALRENESIDQCISMKHEKYGLTTREDYEEEVHWEENVDDAETWVGFVSFGSLKHTTWWDPTSTSIKFTVKTRGFEDEPICSGFGVCLVSKTSETGQSETKRSECGQATTTTTTTTTKTTTGTDDYTCNFRTKVYQKSLECQFGSYKFV